MNERKRLRPGSSPYSMATYLLENAGLQKVEGKGNHHRSNCKGYEVAMARKKKNKNKRKRKKRIQKKLAAIPKEQVIVATSPPSEQVDEEKKQIINAAPTCEGGKQGIPSIIASPEKEEEEKQDTTTMNASPSLEHKQQQEAIMNASPSLEHKQQQEEDAITNASPSLEHKQQQEEQGNLSCITNNSPPTKPEEEEQEGEAIVLETSEDEIIASPSLDKQKEFANPEIAGMSLEDSLSGIWNGFWYKERRFEGSNRQEMAVEDHHSATIYKNAWAIEVEREREKKARAEMTRLDDERMEIEIQERKVFEEKRARGELQCIKLLVMESFNEALQTTMTVRPIVVRNLSCVPCGEMMLRCAVNTKSIGSVRCFPLRTHDLWFQDQNLTLENRNQQRDVCLTLTVLSDLETIVATASLRLDRLFTAKAITATIALASENLLSDEKTPDCSSRRWTKEKSLKRAISILQRQFRKTLGVKQVRYLLALRNGEQVPNQTNCFIYADFKRKRCYYVYQDDPFHSIIWAKKTKALKAYFKALEKLRKPVLEKLFLACGSESLSRKHHLRLGELMVKYQHGDQDRALQLLNTPTTYGSLWALAKIHFDRWDKAAEGYAQAKHDLLQAYKFAKRAIEEGPIWDEWEEAYFQTCMDIFMARGKLKKTAKYLSRFYHQLNDPVKQISFTETLAGMQFHIQDKQKEPRDHLLGLLDFQNMEQIVHQMNEPDYMFQLCCIDPDDHDLRDIAFQTFSKRVNINTLGGIKVTKHTDIDIWWADPHTFWLFAQRFFQRRRYFLAFQTYLVSSTLPTTSSLLYEFAVAAKYCGNARQMLNGIQQALSIYLTNGFRKSWKEFLRLKDFFQIYTFRGSRRKTWVKQCAYVAQSITRAAQRILSSKFQSWIAFLKRRHQAARIIQAKYRCFQGKKILQKLATRHERVMQLRQKVLNRISQDVVQTCFRYWVADWRHWKQKRMITAEIFLTWKEIMAFKFKVAALKIQKAWRAHRFTEIIERRIVISRAEQKRLQFLLKYIREKWAANKIQKQYRAYRKRKARRPFCLMKVKTIGLAWRQRTAMKTFLAIKLQALYRARKVRQIMRQQFQQHFLTLAHAFIFKQPRQNLKNKNKKDKRNEKPQQHKKRKKKQRSSQQLPTLVKSIVGQPKLQANYIIKGEMDRRVERFLPAIQ